MSDINEEIAAKIKDGSYYTDARNWYMRHYLYPITERSFLIIIATFIIITFTLSAMNTSSLGTKSNEIPIIIKVADSTEHFSAIRSLAKSSEATQEAIAKYFIIDYIKAREEYFPAEMHGKKLQYKIKKMKSSSSKKVLNEYQNYIDNLNPYSPITRYKDHTSRVINIKSFKFTSNDATSGKAKVVFEATTTKQYKNEKDEEQEEEKKSNWEATVHFRLPDIETIARTEAPLRFLVKYYRAKLIK